MILKSNVLRSRIKERMIAVGFLNLKEDYQNQNLHEIQNASNEIVRSMLRKILEEFSNQQAKK